MPYPSLEDLPNPGFKPRSPALQANSLMSEPAGKPKNTGVGSLSLLQGIFLTQELNWGLLHCRWILYQLNYQGSPELSYDSATPLLSIYPGKSSVSSKRYMHLNVHCSAVYNSQDMEAAYISTDRRMDKEDVVHVHNGILLSH